jgi:hypothetical protein
MMTPIDVSSPYLDGEVSPYHRQRTVRHILGHRTWVLSTSVLDELQSDNAGRIKAGEGKAWLRHITRYRHGSNNKAPRSYPILR